MIVVEALYKEIMTKREKQEDHQQSNYHGQGRGLKEMEETIMSRETRSKLSVITIKGMTILVMNPTLDHKVAEKSNFTFEEEPKATPKCFQPIKRKKTIKIISGISSPEPLITCAGSKTSSHTRMSQHREKLHLVTHQTYQLKENEIL